MQHDPELIAEFIVESRELLARLDDATLAVEQAADPGEALNEMFRAAHTIKGSASFLGLDPLTEVAHATEDVLNNLRDGGSTPRAETLDVVFNAIDLLKAQIEEVASDTPLSSGGELIELLNRLASGGDEAPDGSDAGEQAASLGLSDSAREMLPFILDDLVEQLDRGADLLTSDEQEGLADLAGGLGETQRTADFLDLAGLSEMLAALSAGLHALSEITGTSREQLRVRLRALTGLLQSRCASLRTGQDLEQPIQTLLERIAHLATGGTPEDAWVVAGEDPDGVLEMDGVVKPSPSGASAGAESRATSGAAPVEATIRVEVDRLERLLNLVGELVLQKNRAVGVATRLAEREQQTPDNANSLRQVSSDLDRVTGELQLAVMQMRLQPLNRLFSKYHRIVRDLARSCEKRVDFEVAGAETEVDKSVIEALADPMVHLIRNAVDHGIESPSEREARGKSPAGRIELRAEHRGGHVVISITDDGAGIDPARIGNKAVERGLVTADELAVMGDADIRRLIFSPGFSTAESVSDLSGRGVGLDVVNTALMEIGAVVDLESEAGVGTRMSLQIPLTLAIMPAMMARTGEETVAIPLGSILEVIRPASEQLCTVGGRSVMRLRDAVIPLVGLHDFYGDTPSDDRLVVVCGLGSRRIGLLADEILGQQEIVTKSLDSLLDGNELISGATIREDGGVSVILDLARILMNQSADRAEGVSR